MFGDFFGDDTAGFGVKQISRTLDRFPARIMFVTASNDERMAATCG